MPSKKPIKIPESKNQFADVRLLATRLLAETDGGDSSDSIIVADTLDKITAERERLRNTGWIP